MKKDCMLLQELLKLESHLIGGCNMLVGGGASVTGHVVQYEELISQLGSQEAKQLSWIQIPRGKDAKMQSLLQKKMICYAPLSQGERVAVRVQRVTNTREGLNKAFVIMSVHPSPTFLMLTKVRKELRPLPSERLVRLLCNNRYQSSFRATAKESSL